MTQVCPAVYQTEDEITEAFESFGRLKKLPEGDTPFVNSTRALVAIGFERRSVELSRLKAAAAEEQPFW